MKFKILLYLFLFVCIALFYQIFNTNKILNHQDALIQNEYQNNKKLKKSLKNIESYCETSTYFSLKGNTNLKESESLIKEEKSLRNQLLEMNSKGGLSDIINIPDEIFLLLSEIKILLSLIDDFDIPAITDDAIFPHPINPKFILLLYQ